VVFDKILNWKLKKGSHEFPGPDGGTCINEAAIVAAGFEYREIMRPNECPACFSRTISAYALGLNDLMPDDVRQRLLPFVMRLAGSADTIEVEIERAEYICMETAKRIVAPLMVRNIWGEYAEALKKCVDSSHIESLGKEIMRLNLAEHTAKSVYDLVEAARLVGVAKCNLKEGWASEDSTNSVAFACANVARHAHIYARLASRAKDVMEDATSEGFWASAVGILDGALAIGKRAEEVDMSLIAARLDDAKEMASCA
jgi:hypothetical protein